MEHGGNEPAIAVEDDDRLETVFVMVGVDQAQLLAAIAPGDHRD